MICEFTCLAKGCKCCHCNQRALSRDYEKPPVRECKAVHVAEQCPHLLDPTEESTRLFGCGCSSERKNGIEVTVWKCARHGRCVTLERGTHLSDESIVRCVVCPDNPANQNQSGGGATNRYNH